MKPIIAAVVLLICAASLPRSQADVAQDQHIEKNVAKTANLIGTWRLVSYKYGQMTDFAALPKDVVQIKYIMPAHFIWVNYDARTKSISRSAGGHYTLEGDKYTETLEYALGEDVLPMIGKDQLLIVKVEGDKLTHSGTISTGLKIEEIWERVKG